MQPRNWTLNRALAAALVVGFAFLLLEIRYEHRAVLADEKASYIPIIFSAVALVLGIIGVALWTRGGRVLLAVTFGVAMLVGVAGLWFHSDGKPAGLLAVLTPASSTGGNAGEGHESPEAEEQAAEDALASPTSFAREGEEAGLPGKAEGGPPLAPAAFAGLGAMGLLACSRRLPADANQA